MLEEGASPASRPAAPVIVGWGSKGTYQQKKRMYGRDGVRGFDFLVDSDPMQHGKVIDGLTVFPPAHLKGMDADNTAIIIFSIFITEIEKVILDLGLFLYSTPISQVKIKLLQKFLPQTKENLLTPTQSVQNVNGSRATSESQTNTLDHSETGVVIQGPFEDGLTIPLIRRFRELYPQARLVLSTWDTTPESSLQYVRHLVDGLVLLPDLENPGHHNRNRQSFTTHEGLKAAKALGCTHALKVRSDVLICEDAFLDYLSALWAEHPIDPSSPAKGRILVPESFSRLVMPLHPSDMIMFGHIDDVLRFWDTGHNSTKTALAFSESMWDFCMGGSVPEVEFTVKYCQKLGDDIPSDYLVALEWLCAHFAFVDDETLGIFWPKMALNVTYPAPARLYSHAIWRAITIDGRAREIAARVDPKELAWQDFIDSHAKWMPRRCKIDKALSIPLRTSEINISSHMGLGGLLEIIQEKMGFIQTSHYRRNMEKGKLFSKRR